jgi:hypothetical protein
MNNYVRNVSISMVSAMTGLSLVMSAAAFAGNGADNNINGCSAALPKAIQYEITSLAIIRGGGVSLATGSVSNEEAVENELCAQLNDYSIETAKSPEGYSEVTVKYENETCSQRVMISADGRVAATSGDIDCQAN